MKLKPNLEVGHPETIPDDRQTEDEMARQHLGGSRGAKELGSAPMTPQRRKKMPSSNDPGHTA
jgi:hypothetical protein